MEPGLGDRSDGIYAQVGCLIHSVSLGRPINTFVLKLMHFIVPTLQRCCEVKLLFMGLQILS